MNWNPRKNIEGTRSTVESLVGSMEDATWVGMKLSPFDQPMFNFLLSGDW